MPRTTTRTRDRARSTMTSDRQRGGHAPTKVPHVDTLPCPATDGTHVLVLHDEDGRPVSRCRYCNETWARLDALARQNG